MAKQDGYFAAREGEDLNAELMDRLTGFRSRINSQGLEAKWAKSYELYYGRHFKTGFKGVGSEIVNLGRNGELKAVTVNHYRNLVRHILVMTTNQKPAFDARAINTDSKSLLQTRLANNILDAYLREKRLGRYLNLAAEHALIFGKGFVKVTWEPSLGAPYGVDTVKDETGQPKVGSDGQPLEKVVYEGDVEISCPNPYQVMVDEAETDFRKCDWVAVTALKNKYALAARYPHLADQILAVESMRERSRYYFLQADIQDELSDALIEVVEFYHKRTEAMPNGRYLLGCGQDVVLYDGPIPYDRLPVYRIVPGEVMGTTEGYSDAFDLMPLQEVMNTLSSTIFSNQQALGLNLIWLPEGANISSSQLSQGLGIIKGPPNAEPKSISLVNTAKEIFDSLQLFERTMETISGVNSVARGNPESSLKSGVALGLVQSMAVQYASGFQQSWAELLEDVGTFILVLLKTFAKSQRMVAMAGKHNRGAMAEFTGEDLANIDRVVVDLGNPMMRTVAGRMNIADQLLGKGLIQTPQEYLTVLSTGNLDPMTEGPEAELALVRKENEDLMDGKPVRAMIGDKHLLHMQEHLTVLKNPDLRRKVAMNDPQAAQVAQAVLEHISDPQDGHMALYQQQNQIWSAVTGEPPAPPLPPPPGPPPGPQGPDQGPPPNGPHGPAPAAPAAPSPGGAPGPHPSQLPPPPPGMAPPGIHPGPGGPH